MGDEVGLWRRLQRDFGVLDLKLGKPTGRQIVHEIDDVWRVETPITPNSHPTFLAKMCDRSGPALAFFPAETLRMRGQGRRRGVSVREL